jgi:hypothetical protein
MSLELKRDRDKSRAIFLVKISKTKLSLIIFLVFLRCSFTSDTQRTFVILKFASPITPPKKKQTNKQTN